MSRFHYRLRAFVFAFLVCLCLSLGLSTPAQAGGNAPVGGGGNCQAMLEPDGTQGVQQAYNNGLYTCSSSVFVPEALIIGNVLQDGTAPACNATHTGMIRYTAGAVNFCNGTSWTGFGGATDINGLTDAYADYAGPDNLIMGRAAAAALTAGAIDNVFIGQGAGATTANSTGTTDDNTAIGYMALANLTTGSNNTALGSLTLNSLTTGVYNTGMGYGALSNTTTANANTAMGNAAMTSNRTGTNNVAVGYSALWANYAKSGSTAIGHMAMFNADDTTSFSVSYNTAVGYQALYGSATAANNTGINNTALGASALHENTDGAENTVVGSQAGHNITSGTGNILIGFNVDTPTPTTDYHLNIGNAIYGDLATGNVGIGTTNPQSTLHVPDGRYFQAGDHNVGAPPAGDCDDDDERGRQSIDTSNNLLYVCNGATRGWDYLTLTD